MVQLAGIERDRRARRRQGESLVQILVSFRTLVRLLTWTVVIGVLAGIVIGSRVEASSSPVEPSASVPGTVANCAPPVAP